MSALTQDRDTKVKYEAFLQAYQLGAVKVYAGGLLKVTTATGHASAASDTAATKVVGVSKEQVDNSGGAAGAKKVVAGVGVYKFAHSGLVQADVGQLVYVSDDQTVTNAATATNDIAAGTLMELDADGGAWVRVGI